jgi:hypothetical protein
MLDQLDHLRQQVSDLTEQLHSTYAAAQQEVAITWHRSTDCLPDDDTIVLFAYADGDVYTGWQITKIWHDIHGTPMDTPPCWAHMPDVPAHLLPPDLDALLRWTKKLSAHPTNEART